MMLNSKHENHRSAGIVSEDLTHVTLTVPLPGKPAGPVEVIASIEDDGGVTPAAPVDFSDSIGLLYRLFPDTPRRTTAEWMRELREGEED